MSGKFIVYVCLVLLVSTLYMWGKLMNRHASGYASSASRGTGSSWNSTAGGSSWGGGGGGHK